MNLFKQVDHFLENFPQSSREVVLASRLLCRGAHLLEAKIDQVLKPLGLEMRQYMALAVISSKDHSTIKPSDMSISLNASRVQITRLLDSLETQGWIERSPSKSDRRSLELRLTPSGVAQLQLATPIVHNAYTKIWQSIGINNLPLMIEALSNVNDELMCSEEAL